MRARAIAGLVAGVILVGSSAAHSLLGWPALRAQLQTARVPAALVDGLSVGWHFGGVAMCVFGLLAVWGFAARLRGRPVALRPLVLVGAAYAAFGAWALAFVSRDPFFLIFIVPGLLLVLAALGPDDARATR